tara:strand:+ start:4704 stop:5492 length:789 start_codon:yes stop_codon:yes gene_type:complete
MSSLVALTGGRRLTHEAITEKRWVSRSGPGDYVTLFGDFIQDVGETINLPWVYTEAGSTGNQTGDFIDAPDGVLRLLHTTTTETEACLLSLGGTNAISPTKEPIFEARVKINLSTDSVFEAASVYEVIVGMMTPATAVSVSAGVFDGVADNVGFRLGGGAQATNSIFMESDDGTTNNDDVDSGVDFTSGAYHVYKIDMSDTSDVRFYVDGKLANNGNTFDMSAIAATDYLEPVILFVRTNAGGTERAHSLDIDYINISSKRT